PRACSPGRTARGSRPRSCARLSTSAFGDSLMRSGGGPMTGAEGRPPTMADIAAHLGVSRQLVSIVLRNEPGASDETRRRVREAVQELGFSAHVGARSLRRTRSTDLGVIFAPAHSTEPEIVEHIYPVAGTHGYDVILSAQTATRSTN